MYRSLEKDGGIDVWLSFVFEVEDEEAVVLAAL